MCSSHKGDSSKIIFLYITQPIRYVRAWNFIVSLPAIGQSFVVKMIKIGG